MHISNLLPLNLDIEKLLSHFEGEHNATAYFEKVEIVKQRKKEHQARYREKHREQIRARQREYDHRPEVRARKNELKRQYYLRDKLRKEQAQNATQNAV